MARLTVDLHTALKPLWLQMTIDDMGCVAEAKFFFHCISKNIYFVRI